VLKLGSIRFRARCTRHPAYDPANGGEFAIRGGCKRCEQLLELFKAHAHFVALARQVKNLAEEERPRHDDPDDDRQASLF